jgi:hypothetical protein
MKNTLLSSIKTRYFDIIILLIKTKTILTRNYLFFIKTKLFLIVSNRIIHYIEYVNYYKNDRLKKKQINKNQKNKQKVS